MPANLTLRSYVRAVLLRADDSADPMRVDGFLDSPEFLKLASVLDINLGKSFARYSALQADMIVLPAAPLGRPDAEPDKAANPVPEVKSFIFPDLQGGGESVAAACATAPAVQASLTVAAPLPALAVYPHAAASSPSEPTKPASAMSPIFHPIVSFRLQNARVGDVYGQKLVEEREDAPALVFLDIQVPPELGLSAELATGELAGTPRVAGEFEIAVIYHFAANGPDRRQKGLVKLLVNPDPKSLWQDKPSDQSAPYWKSESDSQIIIGQDFRILAASKRGRSHAHVGSFRDDDYLIRQLSDSGWSLAIVADGAGSARYSRRGSQLVCREADYHLQKTLGGAEGLAIAVASEAFYRLQQEPVDAAQLEMARKTLHNALYVTVGHAAYHAVKAIHAEIAVQPDLDASYKDFSTTALIAICRRFDFGVLCAAYWVGDGAVGVYRQGQEIRLLGDVDSGEFSGQTRFLDATEVSQEALLKRTRFELVDDLTSLVLMTDGVSDPKFETDARLARTAAWDELWLDLDQAVGLTAKAVGAEQRLLSWLDFWSPGNHDDRTIALILPEATT